MAGASRVRRLGKPALDPSFRKLPDCAAFPAVWSKGGWVRRRHAAAETSSFERPMDYGKPTPSHACRRGSRVRSPPLPAPSS
ncbi:hypothetical protein MTO96_048459 [Rhipicephalus appendiculatus]